ncbi:MAG: PBP1A family penicillin-binding protein [Verrucomicrobiales bacterium]|nr:PBP1A family penicillin-binding protein [Verrucomicrobiales bacterium]
MRFVSPIFRKVRPLFRPGKDAGKLRRFIVAPLAWCSLAGLLGLVAITSYFNIKALSFSLKDLDKLPERTLVFDRNGKDLGYISGHGENRVAVNIGSVSEHFVNAILAREDSRFYDHGGVDYRGVMRAMITNIKAGNIEQGASTITMQLARNTWGLRQKTLARKLQEVALAQRLERRMSKDEILEHYVNRIYFGYGLYGVERASEGYFMKPSSDLTLGESAMLAGIIRGPSVLNPFRDLESAKAVRDEVLDRLVAEELISKADADAAKAETTALRPPNQRTATGSYVLQTLHDLLVEPVISEEDIAMGSLRIYTTIDSDMQKTAQKALDDHLTKIEARSGFPHPSRKQHQAGSATTTEYVQGAVVSIDNRNGAILAMVGGRDFSESPYNRATEAMRQCGSTFKPFVYAAAFDRGGLMPGTYISDDPIRYDMGNGQIWSPSNSDGSFLGNQPAAAGLIRSRNTMSVRVGQIAGLETVQDLAGALKMGDLPDSPVSFLGAFETTVMTLTSAYSTFPARGENHAPFLIERIETVDGRILFENRQRSVPVLRESVAWLTSDVLGKVMTGGTGQAASRLGFKGPSYGKTGTTNDYRDAWFVGFTDKITTGVWVGMDQPKTIMNRGYGSTLALPIWAETMKQAEKSGFPAKPIATPSNMKSVQLCRACGGLEQRQSVDPYQMEIPSDLAPRYRCRGHGTGGIFNFFTRRKEDGEREQYRRRSDDNDGSGVGNAIRGIGRFIFGPSR